MQRVYVCILVVVMIVVFTSCSIESSDSAISIINELTSKRYEGRLVGTVGNEKAAEYIATYFARGGLLPLLGSGYFQEYPQRVANPAAQQTEIIITNRDNSKHELVFGEDYIINSVVEDLYIDLPLTFGISNEGNVDTIQIVSPIEVANLEKGNRAIFVVYDKLRFAPSIPQLGDRLRINITDITRDKLQKDGAVSVQIKCKAAVRDYQAKNVVAAIKGKDSTRAVVLTAHFDHIGRQGSRLFAGALDNASGTAALLTTAAQIKKLLGNEKPEMDIIFACVNSEECSSPSMSLPGSNALVSMLSKQYSDLLNINFDCVGGKNVGPLAMGAVDERVVGLTATLRRLLEKNSVACSDTKFDAESDQYSFLNKGYAAIVIGQTELLNATHIEKDSADTVDSTVIERIAAAASEFILTNETEMFGSKQLDSVIQQDDDKYFDSIQWWRDASTEKDKVLQGKKLKYNEGIKFLFNNTIITVTGYRPLTNLTEVERYYPKMKLDTSYIGYFFDNVEIRNGSLTQISRDEEGEINNSTLNKVYEIPLDIKNVLEVLMEYRDADKYLRIDVCDWNIKNLQASGIVQEPLDHSESGYFLNRTLNSDVGQYYSFTYRVGRWAIEVTTYKKMECSDIYDKEKTIMIPDYKTQVKTKQEMLGLIDLLDIKVKAEQMISDIGLEK